MDRHVRRLDLKIQALVTEGTLAPDPTLPSILNKKTSSSSTPITGSSTPLNPVSQSSMNTSATIANSSIARLAQLPVAARTQSPLVSQTAHNALLQSSHLTNSAPPSPANNSPQTKRESSAGAIDANKRRRLNNAHLGSLPPTPSNLARSSSLGPGTPKPGTPSISTAPASVRASSAAPKPNLVNGMKKKKVAPHQQMRKKALLKKQSQKKSSKKPTSSNGVKNSPSTSDDDASEASGSGTAGAASDDELLSPPSGSGGEEEVDEEGDSGDTNVYCFCRTVSHGNMVACDNPNCPNEWFHWPCVGLTKEPPQGGTWYCPECRPKMAGSTVVKVS
jgi:inhibitor of growth protein 3